MLNYWSSYIWKGSRKKKEVRVLLTSLALRVVLGEDMRLRNFTTRVFHDLEA